MDSLRNVIEKNVIYIGISFFVALVLIFFLGVVVGPKISRGSFRMSVALPTLMPTLEDVSAKEPSLKEEPRRKAQGEEELQVSTQVPETLRKDEAETAETAIPVPVAEEIFTLGEGIYRETSSAEGKIAVSDGRSWYDSNKKGRWFRFSYANISKEVLDTEWAVEWKDAKGNILRIDKGRHYRLFPNDSYVPPELQYPEKAVSYELWIEVERSSGIPASIAVNYFEDPLFEESVLVDYELRIKNEGTPKEQWLIEVKIENITRNKSFSGVGLYFREKDRDGKVIPAKEYSRFRDPDLVTEDGFYPWTVGRLDPGESKDFDGYLTYETASLDFYVQIGKEEEVPSSLTIEYVESTPRRRLELKDQKIIGEGEYWRVELTFSAPRKMSCRYRINYIATDLSGKILAKENSYKLCSCLARTDCWCLGGNFSVVLDSLPRETAILKVVDNTGCR